MPRTAREKSESGIYHIMLRGANRQEIFHDEEDNLRFLETIDRVKNLSSMKIYAWCIMGNHIHLLVKEGKEELSVSMKRIGVSYAWYYNWKYHTTGHLFQDRYRSEKVETDEYLMTVVRYIHQNPVKASTVKMPSEWKWSSYRTYCKKDSYPQGLLESDFVLRMFSEDPTTSIKRFIAFNALQNEDTCLDDLPAIRLTDEDARKQIENHLPGISVTEVKYLPVLSGMS